MLGLFTSLSFYENHVNTTETLGKGQRILYKGFTYKNFKCISVRWEKCQAKSGKLMFVANYNIVNRGPHGMWLSDCSDDINSTICDYAAQVSWKITNTMMEHYHDKGLLGWLDDGMSSACPQIVLNKWIGPEQWDIWKFAMNTKELVTWTGYFRD